MVGFIDSKIVFESSRSWRWVNKRKKFEFFYSKIDNSFMLHPQEVFDGNDETLQLITQHSFESWWSCTVLHEDQRRNQQHNHSWALWCMCHSCHNSQLSSSKWSQDKTLRIILNAMKQGKVKDLQMSCLVCSFFFEWFFRLWNHSRRSKYYLWLYFTRWNCYRGIGFEFEWKKNQHFNIKQETTNLEMKVVFSLLKDWKRTNQWRNWMPWVFIPSTLFC